MAEQRSTGGAGYELTAAKQDYLEALARLVAECDCAVRVKDLAAALGTQPPTVVRTLARLRELGLVDQAQRGLVSLTAAGETLATQLTHRHRDVMILLSDVLGVPGEAAEREACLVEHGLSGESAQRLHEFLLRWRRLPDSMRRRLKGRRRGPAGDEFNLVGPARGSGGRH